MDERFVVFFLGYLQVWEAGASPRRGEERKGFSKAFFAFSVAKPPEWGSRFESSWPASSRAILTTACILPQGVYPKINVYPC
jgi:hypothetical protein